MQNEVFGAFQVIVQDPNIKYNGCESKNLVRKFAEALLFLKDVQVADLPADLDLGIMGRSPFDFFRERISSIVIDATNNRQCGSTVVAYVLPREGNRMHICPYANTFDAFSLSGTLVHEARHVEGFSHSRCDHGTMAVTGSFACDRDYHNYKGSYAIGTEYHIKIAASPDISAELRQTARSRAVASLLERFNTLPLGMKSGALLQAKSGLVSFYDGETQTALVQKPADSVLTTRNSLPTFFDKAEARVESFIFGNQFVETPGDYADMFRKKLSAQERKELVDISYSGDYSCLLFTRKLVCGADADPDVEINLGSLKPVQFLASADSKLVQKNSLAIATQDGSIFALPLLWKELRAAPQKSLRRLSNVARVTSLGPWLQDQEIALSTEGQVYIYNAKAKDKKMAWKLAPGLDPAGYQKIIAPYFWSAELDKF